MENAYIKCQVSGMDKSVLWVFRGGQDLCSSKLILLLPSHLSKQHYHFTQSLKPKA